MRAQAVSTRWTIAISVIAYFLSHAYTGIRHDGTLYAGEALARLFPGRLADDLYFMYGSQGSFTFMPELYAKLIAAFGLGGGAIFGLVLAAALYISATWYLVVWLAPRRYRLPCALSVFLGWSIYGGDRIFAYSEPFLTARSFAEPAVLFSLGLLVRGRGFAALATLLVAMLLHPLVGIAGVISCWIYLALNDRRWWWVVLGGICLLAVLGTLQVGLFADLFTRYDNTWLELVEEANNHAFVLRWSWYDYGLVAFNLSVLLLSLRTFADTTHRRLLIAAALTGVGAIAASLFLVDLLHNPLFAKLQVWRAEWIMQWIATTALPVVSVTMWRNGGAERLAACFLVLGWVAPFSVAPAIVGGIALLLTWLGPKVTVSRVTTRLVAGFAVITAGAVAIQYEARVLKLGLLLDEPARQMIGQLASMNIVLFVACLSLAYALARYRRFGRVASIVLVVASALLWDQRAAWTKTLESYPLGARIWPGVIEPDAKVYWYRDLVAPWVLLGHGNYYTQQQASGAVFSREMVIELDRRRKTTALLEFQEQLCRMMNNLNEKRDSCEPDAVAIHTVCVEGGIDYVVLQSTIENAVPTASYTTGVVENGYEKKFYLYRCSALNPG